MSKDFPSPFGDMSRRFRAYRRQLPAIASGIAVTEFKQNFRRQGLRTDGGVEKWVARQVNKGAKRALLIKTGRLRRSIKPSPTYAMARVVINTPYAAIHNRGGTINGRQRVWATALRSKRTRLRSNPEGPPAKMPARPFAVTTKPLMDDISNEILTGLGVIFKSAKSE